MPDYSFAGYKLGKEPIPETHSQPVYNVTAFGAVPNDSNSDQAAIQAAIDAAEANGGGVVFFPPGEFLVATNASSASPITVNSSNIILKGSGSTPGGTVINMKNHMLKPSGGNNWDTPAMIVYSVTGAPSSQSSAITQNANRGSNVIKVQSASAFVGKKYCRLVMPANTAANSDFLEGKATRSSWTAINNSGVDLKEIHEIQSVNTSTNQIVLKDPIMDDIKTSYGWRAETYTMLEGCGFEDIHFKANFLDSFVHHKDYIHDYAWDGVSMSGVAHSWVRRSRFTNVTKAAGMTSAYASSILVLLVDGNDGHNSTGVGGSSRVLQGLIWDNTTDGTHHGVDMSSRTAGCVVWRVEAPLSSGFDLHASFPRTNLIDLYTSSGLSGQGGGAGNIPHHLSGLTIWNPKRTGSAISNYDLWNDCGGSYCGLSVVNPILVGCHGSSTSFKQSNVKYEESNGSKVTPESLYEAQLEDSLGYRPSWLDDVLSSYASLSGGWYGASSVPVTGVSVAPSNVSMSVGQNVALNADVSPAGATNQAVSWSSSNAAVASVNSSGVVSGIAAGSAVVSAMTNDGGFTDTCSVAVSSASGGTVTVTAVADAYVRSGSYAGNNYGSDDLIVKEGGGDFHRKAYLKFNLSSVGSSVASATLRMVPISSTTSGFQARYVSNDSWTENGVTYSNGPSSGALLDTASGGGSSPIEWDVTSQVEAERSGDGVFSVELSEVNTSFYNKFYSRENGSAANRPQLIIETAGGSVAVTGVVVSPSSISIEVGATAGLAASVAPSNADDPSVVWTTSNSSVATVSAAGVVTGVSAGSAVVTATTNDGGLTDTCSVAVTASSPSTLTVTPSDDAYLQGSTRYNSNILRVESGNRVAYLKFNASGASGTVTGGRLKLKVSGDAGSGTIRVYKGSGNSWTEANLSTGNAPSQGAELGSVSGSFGLNNVVTVNLSSSLGGGTISLIVKMDGGGNDVSFSSKEGATAPVLEVDHQ